VFPTVAAQVGDALFREAGVIEPLMLPHAYSTWRRWSVWRRGRHRRRADWLAIIVRDIILLPLKLTS